MNKGNKYRSRRSTGAKRPYRSPELTVYGDISGVTRSKKGKTSDGTGKPKTRVSIFNK